MFSAVVDGTPMPEIRWSEDCVIGFVLASKGYPGKYSKGYEIDGLEDVLADPAVRIYHMGTSVKGGKVITAGGRVMMVTASGETLSQARDRALAAVGKIRCDNLFHRTDIGHYSL